MCLWTSAASVVAFFELKIGASLLWRTIDWFVLCLCVLSSTSAGLLGLIGMRCGRRFILMTAMGFACCLSFWYRIYLLSATLSNRYMTTFASPLVHLMMFSSGVATTVFYTCLATATLHTFVAITLHPSQYDPISASQTYVVSAGAMGAIGAAVKWSMAAIIDANADKQRTKDNKDNDNVTGHREENAVFGIQKAKAAYNAGKREIHSWFAKDDLQPSPRNADGTPWSPKARLLWWEFTPVKAKPHSIVNLFLLLVIGAACPVFLSYVLSKMMRIRREAKVVLGPAAKCSITRAHIARLFVTLVSMICLSFFSIATMVIDEVLRGHMHLNLLVQPMPRDLALRYTCSCGTGIVLFAIYMTGDELQLTLIEFLRHCARKDRKLPCKCRRCVTGESDYSLRIMDPITTLPIGAARDNQDMNIEDEEIDFFAALKSTRTDEESKRIGKRTSSVDTLMIGHPEFRLPHFATTRQDEDTIKHPPSPDSLI